MFKSKSKVILALLLVLIFILSFGGCQSGSTPPRPFRLFADPDDPSR